MKFKIALKLLAQSAFVIAVTVLAWFNLAASIMAVCAVVLVALAGKIGSLVEFSFGPLKAKLEKTLTESEILLQSLREFSLIQASEAVAARAQMNRWAAEDDSDYQSVVRVIEGLSRAGFSDTDLERVKWPFVEMTIKDAGLAAIGLGTVPGHLGQDATLEWQEVAKNRHDPDRIEAYLRKWNSLSPDRIARIEDMRWMIEHRDIRDSNMYIRTKIGVGWDQGDQ